jgi:hypothetical protein
MRCIRATIVVVEQQYVLHILSVCVAVVIMHAMRMRRVISSSANLSLSTAFF